MQSIWRDPATTILKILVVFSTHTNSTDTTFVYSKEHLHVFLAKECSNRVQQIDRNIHLLIYTWIFYLKTLSTPPGQQTKSPAQVIRENTGGERCAPLGGVNVEAAHNRRNEYKKNRGLLNICRFRNQHAQHMTRNCVKYGPRSHRGQCR